MEARYKQPSTEALNNFFLSLKNGNEIKPDLIKFLVVNFLETLKNAKTPEADALFVAGLICFSESKEAIFNSATLNRGLGISATNQLDDRQKVIYLAKLAQHAQTVELKLQQSDSKESNSKDSIPFKEEIVTTALCVLDRLPFKKKIPTELINKFKNTTARYLNTPKTFAQKVGSLFSDYSKERSKQQKLIDTFGNLISKLAEQDENHDYEAIIIAFTYYLMFELEDECTTTRRPGSELYQQLRTIAKINHTSEIPPEVQKLYFDELLVLLKKTTIEQWELARPKDASKLNIHKLIYVKMYSDLQTIKLANNPPCSLPYGMICKVSSGVVYAIDFSKELAFIEFVNNTRLAEVGKGYFSMAAKQFAKYIGKCGYSYPVTFILQKLTLWLGGLGEKHASITGLPGIFNATYTYLASRKAFIDYEDNYDPHSDPFESLIQIALQQAKKEKGTEDIQFFEAVISLYKLLPEKMKQQLNELLQQKAPVETPIKAQEIEKVASPPVPEENKGITCSA